MRFCLTEESVTRECHSTCCHSTGHALRDSRCTRKIIPSVECPPRVILPDGNCGIIAHHFVDHPSEKNRLDPTPRSFGSFLFFFYEFISRFLYRRYPRCTVNLSAAEITGHGQANSHKSNRWQFCSQGPSVFSLPREFNFIAVIVTSRERIGGVKSAGEYSCKYLVKILRPFFYAARAQLHRRIILIRARELRHKTTRESRPTLFALAVLVI